MLTHILKAFEWDYHVRENLLSGPFSDCGLHICGFVFAWRRRSPMALTLTISALVICIAFHTLENSVATGKDELLPVRGLYTVRAG